MLVVQGKTPPAAHPWPADLARDESGVLIPVETVARGVTAYLADEPLPTPSWVLRTTGRSLGRLQVLAATASPGGELDLLLVYGKTLNAATFRQLQDVADDESAVQVPVEAVLLELGADLPAGRAKSSWRLVRQVGGDSAGDQALSLAGTVADPAR
jgi:hypothetical protein